MCGYPVNQPDHDANDGPLDEVGCPLFQSKLQPNIQIDVIVQHKRAQHEDSNQRAESCSFSQPRAALVELRESTASTRIDRNMPAIPAGI